MKTKRLKRKNFRHLTDEEFENPLLPLVHLCCSETSLHHVVDDTHRFIRATTCQNTGFHSRDFADMYYFYERFGKHIEVLYLLMIRFPDWKTAKGGPLYEVSSKGNLHEILDEDMFGGTIMRFEKLATHEFWDLGKFMKSFFALKTLDEWRASLDEMIRFVFSDEAFPQYAPHSYEAFEHLDKLGEAMFLAYLIRGKDYMLNHCAERFGVNKKKLVDA